MNSSRMPLKKGVSLIIPVLNEEKTISQIIKQCTKQPTVSQLVIVNDGSIDHTFNILERINQKHESSKTLTTVHHKKNKGKGEAIKTGLKYVLGKYVMVQDADLEYSPNNIGKLFEMAEKSRDGIVFGTRSYNKKKGYLLAQLGNLYLNILFNFLFKFKLTDAYTCYKLIPRIIWRKLDLKKGGFEIDAELVSKLGILGYQIQEIPISYNPRRYKEGKKIKWTDLIKATFTAIKIRFHT